MTLCGLNPTPNPGSDYPKWEHSALRATSRDSVQSVLLVLAGE